MPDTVKLSDSQTEVFARALHMFRDDIRAYVDAHPTEYAAFLQKWNEQHQAEEVKPCKI